LGGIPFAANTSLHEKVSVQRIIRLSKIEQ